MVRRTMVQVTGPGGIAETATDMYQPFGGRFKSKECKFVFPSGATIVCKGCEQEKDKHNFQGWQVSAFLVDECQQFLESQIIYFISRLRTEANMKTQMLMTANPDYDSFLRKWLEGAGYLDERGLPRKDRDGKVMWFIRIGNDMVWRETREELLKDYGDDCGPMSFKFLPATCEDNPVLLARDKTYKFKLMNLPRVEMERLFLGSWYAREESSGFWKSSWCPKVINRPAKNEIIKRVRAWDIAGSKKSETNTNPDYTASVMMSLYKDGRYVVEDVFRFRGTYHEVYKKIADTAKMDGTDVQVLIPQDAGAAGLSAVNNLQQYLAEQGIHSKKVKTSKSKLDRFRPFAAACESGAVDVVENCGTDLENKIYNDNGFWYSELEAFQIGNRAQKDDCWDCCSDCFTYLATSKKIPNFMSGIKNFNLSTVNPFNKF